jgi:uncharacterized membrane protein YkgB
MIMLSNSKVKILQRVNFITILLIELGIISMFVYVSLQWVKNSEIVSENSLPYSTNVPLIGFYHGPNKLWSQSQTHFYQASSNWIPQIK